MSSTDWNAWYFDRYFRWLALALFIATVVVAILTLYLTKSKTWLAVALVLMIFISAVIFYWQATSYKKRQEEEQTRREHVAHNELVGLGAA
ncbi:hypothetical protein BCR33DRAFT_712935 [Rhizoclosmatium globosum]|uniref:Uncharacterized protein n=1 Tax=Rhizoclosmatium globosum TaxID=329046 RepID=A0A1Y2CVS7_9FUNG|nr:hypothetical protein BCR33DRAFT_712935 [Rhizoclosmatium globosum]|eukprot:ORY50986.1 hypothetical protein BCR33DRAFT_712935 [Rhizoclosmatium globosum]